MIIEPQQSRFLKSRDVPDDGLLLFIENLKRDPAEILSFPNRPDTQNGIRFIVGPHTPLYNQQSKVLGLNNTNQETLIEAYGTDTMRWRAKPVFLYVVDTQTSLGRPTKGVRIRIPDPNQVSQMVQEDPSLIPPVQSGSGQSQPPQSGQGRPVRSAAPTQAPPVAPVPVQQSAQATGMPLPEPDYGDDESIPF